MISILRNDGFGVAVTLLAPREACARLLRLALARAERRPRRGDLRRREAVLRDPQRERALLQERRAVGSLRDRAHAGGERDREDRERDEDLD